MNNHSRFRAMSFKQAFVPSALLMLVSLCLIVLSNYVFDLSLLAIPYSAFQSLSMGALLGCALFIILFCVLNVLTPYLSSLQTISTQLHALFANFTWPMIVVISVLAGVGEEMLFRGLLQNALIYVTNSFWGILFSAIIFGVLHYLNHMYAFIASIMGGVIAYIYFVTQDLVLVMTLHAVYDFFAFSVIVKAPHLLYKQELE